jgi:hypothetical protein
VGDCLRVCPHVLLGLLALGEEGRVLVGLLLLGILLLGVLHRLGILLQGVLPCLGIPLAVLPCEVLPIRMGFWEVRSSFLVYLGGLLGLVLLLSIGLHHLR